MECILLYVFPETAIADRARNQFIRTQINVNDGMFPRLSDFLRIPTITITIMTVVKEYVSTGERKVCIVTVFGLALEEPVQLKNMQTIVEIFSDAGEPSSIAWAFPCESHIVPG